MSTEDAPKPAAYWIPRAEQFCLAPKSGARPFAKAWEPLFTETELARLVLAAAEAERARCLAACHRVYDWSEAGDETGAWSCIREIEAQGPIAAGAPIHHG